MNEFVTNRNELLQYWLERDRLHVFYPIHGHFKTELISKTARAKKIDKTICIIWKVREWL